MLGYSSNPGSLVIPCRGKNTNMALPAWHRYIYKPSRPSHEGRAADLTVQDRFKLVITSARGVMEFRRWEGRSEYIVSTPKEKSTSGRRFNIDPSFRQLMHSRFLLLYLHPLLLHLHLFFAQSGNSTRNILMGPR